MAKEPEESAAVDRAESHGEPPPWQFSLMGVLFVTANVAVALALSRWLGWGFLLLAAMAGSVCLVYWIHKQRIRADPKRHDRGFPILGLVVSILVLVFLMALFLPVIGNHRDGRPRSRTSVCAFNLFQIGTALHAYHDQWGTYPPAYVADENGRPMHSWRVLILPHLGESALYEQYRFDEPWDGPNNALLGETSPSLFQCLSDTDPNNADYVVVVGPGTMFPGAQARSYDDVTDSAAKTILVIELANSPYHWMEPRDLTMDELLAEVEAGNAQAAFGVHFGNANAVFVDGHAGTISSSIDKESLKAMLTVAGDDNLEEE